MRASERDATVRVPSRGRRLPRKNPETHVDRPDLPAKLGEPPNVEQDGDERGRTADHPAMSHPSVCGPPWRTARAKIGMRTTYGIPVRLTNARRSKSVRMGRNEAT